MTAPQTQTAIVTGATDIFLNDMLADGVATRDEPPKPAERQP